MKTLFNKKNYIRLVYIYRFKNKCHSFEMSRRGFSYVLFDLKWTDAEID